MLLQTPRQSLLNLAHTKHLCRTQVTRQRVFNGVSSCTAANHNVHHPAATVCLALDRRRTPANLACLDESLVAMLVGSCGAWRSTIAGPPRIACALSGRKWGPSDESLKLDSRAEYRLLTTFCAAVPMSK